MKCPKCNSKLPDKAKFCLECGLNVSAMSSLLERCDLICRKKRRQVLVAAIAAGLALSVGGLIAVQVRTAARKRAEAFYAAWHEEATALADRMVRAPSAAAAQSLLNEAEQLQQSCSLLAANRFSKARDAELSVEKRRIDTLMLAIRRQAEDCASREERERRVKVADALDKARQAKAEGKWLTCYINAIAALELDLKNAEAWALKLEACEADQSINRRAEEDIALDIMLSDAEQGKPIKFDFETISTALAVPRDINAISDEMLRNSFSVFSLTEAQNRSLDAIITNFPDLREDAAMARIEFNRAFGQAIIAVDDFLTKNSQAGYDWPTRKTELKTALDQMDMSQISHAQAVEYVKTVRNRTKGVMPQDIYDVLIAFHPVYSNAPHKEFVDHFTREYSSDGTGKSLGVKISIEYPRSWRAEEGRRPHILQKFRTPDGLVSAMIMIKEVFPQARQFSDQEILDHLVSKALIERETPGVSFLSSGRTTIAGKSASFCDIILTRSAPAGDITIRGRMYNIIHKGKIITATFDVAKGGIIKGEEMNARFGKYQKLFEFMATGIDFFDKYE